MVHDFGKAFLYTPQLAFCSCLDPTLCDDGGGRGLDLAPWFTKQKSKNRIVFFWTSTVVQWTLVNGVFWIEKSYIGHACNSDTAFSDLKDGPKI